MSDLELLELSIRGDRAAMRAVKNLYDQPLARFFHNKVGPQDSNDLKQQVWVELFKSRPQEVRVSLRSYMWGIARHILIAHLNKKRGVASAAEPLTDSMANVETSVSQRVEQKLGAEALRALLRRLPMECQLLLELRYVQELSTAELASVYSVPPGTIKSRLSNARKQLEPHLQSMRG